MMSPSTIASSVTVRTVEKETIAQLVDLALRPPEYSRVLVSLNRWWNGEKPIYI